MAPTETKHPHPTLATAMQADGMVATIVPVVVFLDVGMPHVRGSARQVRGVLTWHGPQTLIDSATERVVDRHGPRIVVPT